MRALISKTMACAAIMPLILLAACGGGGGVSSTPTPTSSGTGSISPNPPSPPPIEIASISAMPPVATTNSAGVNYDDAEYRLSNVDVAANALAAYNTGATGAGVKIAIIDSGLSDPGAAFAGRIDPASTDLVSNRGITDTDGHGTSVSAIAAAGRDGKDMMGVAFNATVLVARTDTVGSCGSSTGCQHNDDMLARGVDLARQNGARVINMSLGGNEAATSGLVTAVRAAAAAGIIVVISAGNDGGVNPDAFSQIAAANGMNGMVVIAGSHDAGYNMSSFSDRAGTYGPYYLTAMGEAVRSINQNAGHFLFSGTSYSAPAIAGAAAVLAQAFPNLTGKQIVDLLFSTATDAGAAGVDGIFGHGILNLGKAFQPQGGTSLAGSTIAVSLTGNGTTSAAMGDATAQTGMSAGKMVILDGYGRAYTMNLGSTLGRPSAVRPLIASLMGDVHTTDLSRGPIAVSLNVAQGRIGEPAADIRRLGLSSGDARMVRMLSGRVMARIGRNTQAVLGMAEGAGRLSAMIAGQAEVPFLVAREPDATPGFAVRHGVAFAIRHDLGFAAVTVASERGVVSGPVADSLSDARYSSVSVRFDRRLDGVSLSGGIAVIREDASVLGARFGAALGGDGANTKIIDARVAWQISDGWSLAGAVRQGWTRADAGGTLVNGKLLTSAFAFDLVKAGHGYRFGLRVAQPMRVASGGYDLSLPSSYDYATGTVGHDRQYLSLTPKGRELDLEAAYGARLAGGWIDANLFQRREPGNVAAAPADHGIAVRYSLAF